MSERKVPKLRFPEFSGDWVQSTIELIMVKVPNIREQTQIAEFLTNIDDKITQVNTQLEKSKLFKKSLFQQMFI